VEEGGAGRCLLDCLCKDEMKCCKSVPAVQHVLQPTDRGAAPLHRRSLTSPNRLEAAGGLSCSEEQDQDEREPVRRTYRSMPEMAATSTQIDHDDDDDDDDLRADRHGIRTRPADTLIQVLYRLYCRHTNRQGWNCWGVGGLNPQFMSTDAHF